MEQILVYVIIGIIYVIVRALKKPEQQAGDIGDQRPGKPVNYNPERTSTDRPKPVTFEDLLQEIMEAKQPKTQTPEPVSSPRQPQWTDYDEDLEDEKKDLEETAYRKRQEEQQRTYAIYEDAKRQAFERPSLEETMHVTDTKVRYERFKAFEQEKQRNLLQEYTIDIQDTEGLRKAFVMSEILNRKF